MDSNTKSLPYFSQRGNKNPIVKLALNNIIYYFLFYFETLAFISFSLNSIAIKYTSILTEENKMTNKAWYHSPCNL